PAIRRASVVLPTPGGPHSTIDGRFPESSRLRSGAPGASRWSWPATSSSERGRMRSASGRAPTAASASTPRGVLIRSSGCAGVDDVDTLRGNEAEARRVQLDAGADAREADVRGAAQRIQEAHALRNPFVQPHLDGLEIA